MLQPMQFSAAAGNQAKYVCVQALQRHIHSRQLSLSLSLSLNSMCRPWRHPPKSFLPFPFPLILSDILTVTRGTRWASQPHRETHCLHRTMCLFALEHTFSLLFLHYPVALTFSLHSASASASAFPPDDRISQSVSQSVFVWERGDHAIYWRTHIVHWTADWETVAWYGSKNDLLPPFTRRSKIIKGKSSSREASSELVANDERISALL